MSVRFCHCDVTIFPFIIKKVFCGEILWDYIEPCFLSNFLLQPLESILTLVLNHYAIVDAKWFFCVFKTVMLSLPKAFAQVDLSFGIPPTFLFNWLALVISLSPTKCHFLRNAFPHLPFVQAWISSFLHFYVII